MVFCFCFCFFLVIGSFQWANNTRSFISRKLKYSLAHKSGGGRQKDTFSRKIALDLGTRKILGRGKVGTHKGKHLGASAPPCSPHHRWSTVIPATPTIKLRAKFWGVDNKTSTTNSNFDKFLYIALILSCCFIMGLSIKVGHRWPCYISLKFEYILCSFILQYIVA